MSHARLRHLPALDGLRGVAVVGVLAFHLGHLRGGYLGVDLFFVLSGFLITSLLLAEWRDEGRIDLRAFWARRVRRLLPALFLVIGAITVYASTEPAGLSLGALRGDALATLGYGANWHAIFADHGYWELFAAPSLLAHTWSLAIEEQLYVVWPLAVVAVLRLARGRPRVLLVTSLALAAASWTTMAVLHAPGGDTSRVYFGTDTRAGAVLIGAALAALATERRVGGRAAHGAGLLAAGALALAWVTVGGETDGLYEGGFAACGLAAAVVIASIVDGRGPLARLLAARPLRHLGEISYGLYLWHWPVFVVMTPARAGLHGWPLLVGKLAVTLALSELSYRLVERPIRRGSMRGWRIRIATPAAAGAAVIAVVTGTATPAPASVPAPAAPVVQPASTTTESVRMLVVGDSGAAFLGEGLARTGAAAHVEVRNAGTVACGLLTDGGRLRFDGGGYLPDPPWCGEWPARWTTELASFRPDVALLVVGWPGLGDREIEGRWRHPCDAVFDRHYADGVRRAIAVLGATGARVVVADSPYLTLPVVQSDHALRVDCLNTIYHRAAAAAGADVLPLAAWLCDGPRGCRIEDDGVTLRTDGIHFRDDGADIAAAWVLGELLPDAGQEQHTEHGEHRR